MHSETLNHKKAVAEFQRRLDTLTPVQMKDFITSIWHWINTDTEWDEDHETFAIYRSTEDGIGDSYPEFADHVTHMMRYLGLHLGEEFPGDENADGEYVFPADES